MASQLPSDPRKKIPPPGVKDVINKGTPPEGADLKGEGQPPKPDASLEPVGPSIDAYLKRISDERQKRTQAAGASAPKQGEKVEKPRVNGKLYPEKETKDGDKAAQQFSPIPSKWS